MSLSLLRCRSTHTTPSSYNSQVLMDMHARPLNAMRPALIINLDVKDSHEEAALAAPHALELCSLVSILLDDRERTLFVFVWVLQRVAVQTKLHKKVKCSFQN